MGDLPEFYQKHYSHTPWTVHVLPVTLYVPVVGSREEALELVREILTDAGHDIGLVTGSSVMIPTLEDSDG